MRSYVVRVVHQTEGAVLSVADLDANPASVLERKLAEDEVEDLIRRVKTGDSWDSSRIEAIGDALYRWLDGPQRWLETILADRSDVALLLDTDGALRGLPWELLHATTFLCAHPHRLVTPVRRLSKPKETLCLKDRYNHELASHGFPHEQAFAVGKSYADTVMQLVECAELCAAIVRTYTEENP